MTTEEFQRIVLEKLGGLEEKVDTITGDVSVLKSDVSILKKDVSILTERVDSIEKTLNAVHEQTVDLTEYRVETKAGLLDLKSMMSRIEIATADNWGDIARLKSII